MNKLIVTTALALVGASTLMLKAQDDGAPPGGMPMPEFQMPPGPPLLSKDWAPDTMTEDAVQKAEALLARVSRTYRDAPAISDTITLRSRTPMGEQTDTMSFAIAGNDMRLSSGPMTLTAADGTLFLEVEGNTKKYLSVPTNGDLDATLEQTIPGFRVPVPHRELRRGATGRELYEGFSLGVLEELRVAGFRQRDGMDQILMKANNGDLVVTVDPATSAIKSIDSVFSPPMAPPGLTVGVDIGLAPSMSSTLETPIKAPEANGRRAVSSMEELLRPVSVGEPAIDFTLMDHTGKEVRFADLKGSVVVLDFWASWCVPCQRGLPKIDELAKWAAQSGKNVKVFGVDVWERVPAEERQSFAADFWSKRDFSFPTLVDAKDTLVGAYGIQGIPVTIVIDAAGVIAAVHEGALPDLLETLKSDVEKALAAAPATP